MGKVYRHLYHQVHDWENLLLAWRKARKGKRGHAPAATFEQRAGENLLAIQQALVEKSYQPGGYVSFTIHEPKKRLISAAPFRDRVVHHALCNVLEPIFERRFIHDSYANRVGKGTHAALDRCQAFARRYPYVLCARCAVPVNVHTGQESIAPSLALAVGPRRRQAGGMTHCWRGRGTHCVQGTVLSSRVTTKSARSRSVTGARDAGHGPATSGVVTSVVKTRETWTTTTRKPLLLFLSFLMFLSSAADVAIDPCNTVKDRNCQTQWHGAKDS